jgi:GAF domain-containing protein/signal transduction histidine kinase
VNNGTEGASFRYAQFDSNLVETFELICRYAQEMIGVDHSGFVRFDASNETAEVVADYPRLAGLVGEKLTLLGVPAEERLLADEQPLIIKDVDAAADLGDVQALLQRYDIKSLCIVKVRFNDVVIGSFSLDWRRQKREFTDEQIALCRSFAEFASKLIVARQLAGWLESFHDATVVVTSERQLDALLRTIVEQAQRLFNTQKVGLWQRCRDERGNDSLLLVACSDPNLLRRRLQKPEGMSWQLILSNEPFLRTTDYDQDEHRAPGFENVFGSVLVVPLLRQDERIGVIYLSDVPGRLFTEFDVRLLRHFADIATIALQQTALVERMRSLSVATADISANFDLESLDARLTSIAAHTARILRGETCGVLLLDGDGRLMLRASHGHRLDAEPPVGPYEIRDEPGSGLTGAIFARLLKKHAALREATQDAEIPLAINLWGSELANDAAVRSRIDLSPSGHCFSLLAMPLLRREHNSETVVGMLRVSNRKGIDDRPAASIHFNDEDISVLRVFSEAIVVAIQSARLFEQLKEQKNLYARLLETWNTLASEETLVARLEKIASNVVSITGMSYCRILLAEDSEEFLNVKAAILNRPLDKTLLWNPQGRVRTRIAEWPHLQQALIDGRAYELHDGDATLVRLTELLELRNLETGKPVPIRSMFAVPMMIARRPVGLLSIGEIGVPGHICRELRPEDKNLISSIATQATFMIDREWRVESIQRARQGVHKLALALALGDQKDALGRIVYAIKNATRSDIVTLYTTHPFRAEIVGPATTTPLDHPALNVRPAAVSAVGRILSYDDLYYADDVIGDPILGGTFAEREGVKSSLGTPIWLKNDAGKDGDAGESRQTVGVLFVNYRSRHTFTSEDEEIVRMFAHLAAVTIQNKDLFERERRKARTEAALRESARVLTQTWSVDDPGQPHVHETLQNIAEQARKVADACGRGVTSVLVALREEHRFVAFATSPKDYQRDRRGQLWRMIESAGDGSPTDLMRVADTGEAKLNVAQSISEQLFPTVREDTLSQLIVAIRDGPKYDGVIVVESTDPYGLEDEGGQAFELMSTLALDAIRAARHRADLSRSRKREEDLEDLAFAFIKSGVLVHRHKNDILDVTFVAKTLRLRAEEVGIHAALQNDFDLFEEAARTLEDLLKSTGTVELQAHNLNEILVDWNGRLRQRREYDGIELVLAIDKTNGVMVRVDADLLREVFAILSTNARRAMADRQRKQLTIETSLDDRYCRVAFSDTGKGVDASELDGDGRYLRSEAARARGSGYGMRTAELIVRRFEGALLKPKTGADGTTNTITLRTV